MESENGRGLCNWYFGRGFPTAIAAMLRLPACSTLPVMKGFLRHGIDIAKQAILLFWAITFVILCPLDLCME
jgi:hypothetical protein